MPKKKPRPHNGGQWTKARYHSFIMSALRSASMRWGPKNAAKKAAKVSYGKYLCAECKKVIRAKDTAVDHILPIVPVTGFDSWDGVISRLFCEVDGFQLLCKDCHKIKTDEENKERKENTNG